MTRTTSLPAPVLRRLLRAVAPLLLSPRIPVRIQRRVLDRAQLLGGRPSGVEVAPGELDGLPGEWVTPSGTQDRGVLLYLHGGGFVLGSPRTHRKLVNALAVRLGLPAFVLDYRRAPEHPYPAALDDALAAYRALLRAGHAPADIVVAGDSCGGGLSLGLAMALRDAGEPLPGVLGLLCPWLDVAPDLAGTRPESAAEPLLRTAALRRWAIAYAGATPASEPGLSPVGGMLEGLPPIVLHDAGDDPLSADADRLGERARAAGVNFTRRSYAGLWHAFQIHVGAIASADRALDEFARDVRMQLRASGGPRVGIIGAGMSGLLMAAKLREAGMHDFTVYEKAAEVGGTWRDNRYPGLTCDVPSRFYSYSFAPNPDWTHPFAPGPEILDYFTRFADGHGLREHIRFDAEVTAARWQDGRWQLRTAGGGTDSVDVLVSATGVLHHPKLPAIPGLESFAGKVFHSARWDDSARLEGARVGVIGTGSTGVQIATAIAGRTARLHVFQRTAQWILPIPNRPYSPVARAVYRRLPALSRVVYRMQQRQIESILGTAVTRAGWQRSLVSGLCRLNLRLAVRDPELRRRLTSDYQPLCKRLVMSAGFYPAMQTPGVELVTEDIARIESRGVVTRDGQLHELDVLVLATGFDAHAYMRPMVLAGEDGVTIDERWSDGPQAYRTVALSGFPNFFMIMGPHSPVGNQSLISVAEAQVGYVMRWIEHLSVNGARQVQPTQEATDRFNAEMRRALPTTVWATGCRSWYLGADGLPELWPWTPRAHRAMLREPAFDEFAIR